MTIYRMIILASIKLLFLLSLLKYLVAMATLNVHRVIMGKKKKIGIYCYFIADIFTKGFQKYLLSGPLPNIYFLS